MKKLVPILLAATLVAGCSTFYASTVTITEVVKTSMKMWANLSNKGLTTPEIDAKVINAHDKYRAACSAAKNALITYKQSGDPAQRNLAIASAKTAAQQVLNLIVPLISTQNAAKLQTQLEKANTL